MGAYRFDDFVKGKDLKQTFNCAVSQAAWDNGHAGYTGTIAEKHEVVLRTERPMTQNDAQSYANEDLRNSDHDKWGPCWAVRVKDGDFEGFLFYGYASS